GHGRWGNGPSLILGPGGSVRRIRAGRLPTSREDVRAGVEARAPVSGGRRRRSEDGDVGRLRILGSLRDLEAHALVVLQVAVAAALDLRVVGEDVGGAVRRCDEAEPLVGVEPLHGAFSHAVSSFFHCTAGAKKLFGAAGRTSRDVGSKKKDSPSACNKNLQARSNTGKNYDCFSLRGFAARGRSRSARGEHGLADLLAGGVVGVRRARGHG